MVNRLLLFAISLNCLTIIKVNVMNPEMTANYIKPAFPTHPGEVLKNEIEYRGISQKKLAQDMNVSYSLLNEVLNCKRPVNTELALLIEACLGLDAEPLLRLQMQYNVFQARHNESFVEKLRKVAAVMA